MQWVSCVWLAAAVVLIPGPRSMATVPRSRKSPATSVLSAQTRRVVVTGTGLAAVVVLIWPTAYVAAGITGVIGAGVMWRAPTPRSALPVADRVELVMICELWAGCLDAGLPMPAALAAVLDVVRGSTDRAARDDSTGRLSQVCGLLTLGVDPEKAWQSADLDPDLAGLGMAARRSAAGGSGLAPAVRDHARVLRQATAATARRRAARASVLMAAPLGLCFLPAFICLGLAPVVIALVGTLGIFP